MCETEHSSRQRAASHTNHLFQATENTFSAISATRQPCGFDTSRFSAMFVAFDITDENIPLEWKHR